MLFLKHIYRSIKKSPLQPIIILVTLMLSVATFLTAVKIAINVAKETALYKNVDNYICDITIKPSKNDDVRMLFVEDAKDVLGDAGTVHGEFNLTALFRRDDYSELVDISAADLLSSDAFYQYKFYEYGEFTDKNINNSILLSSDLAGRFDMHVGDTFTINLLNQRMDFTIQAIGVGDGFLNDFEGVINIGAVLEAIAAANPAISSFTGTEMQTPYTVLKIRINDPARIDEFIEKFENDERFAGKSIIKESVNTGSADFVHMLSLIVIIVCAALITVLSSIVISTSLDLLSKKRLKDSALFMLSGADNSQLNAILYLECFIYSIISAVCGLIISIGINKKINVIFKWNTDDITFKLYDIPIALFAAPAIVLLTALIHTSRAKKLSVSERVAENSENKAHNSSYKSSLVLLLTAAALTIPMLSFAPKYRFIFAIPALISCLAFIFFFLPCLVDIISKGLIKTLEKREYVPPKTMLTLKNMSVSYPLKHTARLITLLLTIICAIFTCLGALNKETKKLSAFVDCQYIAISANEKTDPLLENLDPVDNAFRMTLIQSIMTESKTAILGISIDENSADVLNPDIAPSDIPNGDEVVITSGIANLENKKVGDSITFDYETQKYTFKITEIVKSSSNIIFFDAAHIGEKNDLLCIKTDAAQNSEEYQEIANFLETRGSTMINFDVILIPVTERLISYSEMLSYVVFIAFITTVLGIINVLVSSYFARKQERDVYYTVGMSKSHIRKTQMIEILYIMLISLLSIPLLTFGLVLILDLGLSSFGVDLFYI